MSPNQPLYLPSVSNTLQVSVDYSVQDFECWVSASKITVAVNFYRHTWYAQGMSSWTSTGLFQGESCGPFRQTYGAKPGEACQRYGVLIYSEAR